MKILSSWTERATERAHSEPIAREADTRECAAIADALGIVGCRAFSARYSISPLDRGRYLVAGAFSAILIQTCVVTLEPFDQTVEEPFEIEFWPPDQIADDSGGGTASEIEVDGLAGEDPEPVVNGRLQIGPVLYELLAAATDPFPRHPDAELEQTEAGSSDPEPAQNPFAVLRGLKPGENGGPNED